MDLPLRLVLMTTVKYWISHYFFLTKQWQWSTGQTKGNCLVGTQTTMKNKDRHFIPSIHLKPKKWLYIHININFTPHSPTFPPVTLFIGFSTQNILTNPAIYWYSVGICSSTSAHPVPSAIFFSDLSHQGAGCLFWVLAALATPRHKVGSCKKKKTERDSRPLITTCIVAHVLSITPGSPGMLDVSISRS